MSRLRRVARAMPWRGMGLVLWVFILFGSTLDHGFFYDDGHSIVDNERLQQWRQIPSFFVDPGAFSAMPEARMYRPLLLVSYALNFLLGGDAAGFHLVNLALHATVVLLFWRLLCHLRFDAPIAWGMAALFAAHPVITEPVNYVSSRSSSLTTLFLMAAMIALIRPGRQWQHARLTGWSAAAMLTKATGLIVLPLVALYLVLTNQLHRWRLMFGPGLVGLGYLLGTWAIIGKALSEPVRSLAAQLATQSKAVVFYVRTIVMPVDLSIEPQFSVSASFLEAPVLVPLVFVGSVILIMTTASRGSQGSRRGSGWIGAFGVGWFILALAPTVIVPLHVLVNEHRLYAALPGALLSLGVLGDRWPRSRLAVLAGGVLLLGLLTLDRNDQWSEPAGIWQAAIQAGPQMPRAHVNLGKVYLEAGEYERAIAATQRGLLLDPGLARGHYNIATANLHLGRYEQSVAGFQRALDIDPVMLEAWNNLGNVYKETGRTTDAIDSYRQALELAPRAPLYHNMGSAFLAAALHDSAAHYFEQALLLDPGSRESYTGLATSLRKAGRLTEAARCLTMALGLWPTDAHFLSLLAHTQAALGRQDEAISTFGRTGRASADIRLQLGRAALGRGDHLVGATHFEAGLLAEPDNASLHNALGEARLMAGERELALGRFRRAAELDPSLSDAFRNIGLVYLRHRRFVEAQAALERALSLASSDDQAASGGTARTWELLARVHEGRQQWAPAMAAYTRAIEGAPDRAVLYHNLAVLNERTGSQVEAERLYRGALARDPSLLDTRHALGHLLLAAGRAQEAVVLIESVVAARPEDVEALINLAMAYQHLGRTADARSTYQRCLQSGPADLETRQRVEAQLQRLPRQDAVGETSH